MNCQWTYISDDDKEKSEKKERDILTIEIAKPLFIHI